MCCHSLAISYGGSCGSVGREVAVAPASVSFSHPPQQLRAKAWGMGALCGREQVVPPSFAPSLPIPRSLATSHRGNLNCVPLISNLTAKEEGWGEQLQSEQSRTAEKVAGESNCDLLSVHPWFKVFWPFLCSFSSKRCCESVVNNPSCLRLASALGVLWNSCG